MLSSSAHDQREPMNGGYLRSSASPMSMTNEQSHSPNSSAKDYPRVQCLHNCASFYCKQLRLIFLGKGWALNFAMWKMRKWKQVLESMGFGRKKPKIWLFSCYQSAHRMGTELQTCLGNAVCTVSLGQQWPVAKKHCGLESAQLCAFLSKLCASAPVLVWYTTVANKES